MIGASALLGGTVQTVEEVLMDGYNISDGRTRQEEDEAYGYKISTDKGRADIVFRNSSNGYYGGSLSASDIKTSDGMTEIVKDWNA